MGHGRRFFYLFVTSSAMKGLEENLGYKPSIAVRFAHSMPRFTRGLGEESNEFSISMEYAESTAFVPATILLLSVLSLFIYHFICCCCTCKSCKCADYDHIDDDVEEIELKVAKQIAFKVVPAYML